MFQKDHSKSSVDNALNWPGGMTCETHTKSGWNSQEDPEVRDTEKQILEEVRDREGLRINSRFLCFCLLSR